MGFEIIDIRRFEPKEFSNLLEAESRAWNDTLRWDFATSTRIINACLRDQRLSGYALVGEGRIRGYCFFFYDGEKGIIGDLFIHPELAGLSHERELLEHALETLLGTPGLRRIEAQLPHYEREGLEPCFLSRRFQSFLRRFMSLSLESHWRAAGAKCRLAPTAEKPWVREGIGLISWDKRFNDDAAEMLYQAYRQHVDALINDQYASVMGATRLVENIFHNQGCGDFLSRVSRMAVHRPTQQLAGIITVTEVRPRTAHIPQVGVGPSFQGLGVGTALMEAAFQDLAEEGFEQVTLTVTDANAGAVRLYQRLGFGTFKTFGAFIYNRDSGLGAEGKL
ncbi:MAG TPA: GNAT family N-acetyltransferase [Terriglobia bacterium]|nr:GNAT family N-acetyltransferase [Terriglobia bacterium]